MFYMVGVVLFSLFGVLMGLIASRNLIKRLSNNDYNVVRVFNRIEKFDIPIGFLGILVGVWNVFSPNFGFKVDIPGADLTIFGALIPASLVALSGFVLVAHFIFQYVNISVEDKQKVISLADEYSDVVGVATVIFSFLHLVTYQTVLL